MATATEIRNKAAKKLGLLGTGQTVPSGIAADLDDAYAEVYAELASLGLATWASSDAVPAALVYAIVAWVAGVRADEYSIPTERYVRVMRDFRGDAQTPSAEDRIRAIIAPPKIRQTKIENF